MALPVDDWKPRAPVRVITSRDNPRLRAVRALHDRRGRREQQAYLIDGVTLTLEALAAGQRPLLVLRDDTRLTPSASDALDRALAPHADRVLTVAPGPFREVATTEHPQGVLAVLPLPPAAGLPQPRAGELLLVADGMQDPGNLGTLLRSAEAAGVSAVLTTQGTTDPFAPRVVRAGMGAHFRLPLVTDVAWPDLARALGGVLPMLGADMTGARAYDEVDWTAGGVLVVGSEAGGLSSEARSVVETLIAVPLAPAVESLNAAVAASVIVFEAARQRRRSRAAGSG